VEASRWGGPIVPDGLGAFSLLSIRVAPIWLAAPVLGAWGRPQSGILSGRLTGWKEKIFGRRYRAIVVSNEEEAQIARLR
jgi:hypothetical protein